jgi:hypothetical protein
VAVRAFVNADALTAFVICEEAGGDFRDAADIDSTGFKSSFRDGIDSDGIDSDGIGCGFVGAGADSARATDRAVQTGQDGIGHQRIFRGGERYAAGDSKGRNPGSAVCGPGRSSFEVRRWDDSWAEQLVVDGKEQTTHLFAVGDKVYPSKVDVNVAKDTVSMTVVACDTCNKTDPPTYNKAQVVFQFPKGSLVKAGAGEVEDVIGQVLSISEEEQQGGGDQGGQQQGNDQGQQGGGQQQQQQQAEPQSIEKGMTTDQVEGAMGKPEKIVNLGPKKIYVYKDLKVTFLNGKVFDVQ